MSKVWAAGESLTPKKMESIEYCAGNEARAKWVGFKFLKKWDVAHPSHFIKIRDGTHLEVRQLVRWDDSFRPSLFFRCHRAKTLMELIKHRI
jgi:hypothetical protein